MVLLTQQKIQVQTCIWIQYRNFHLVYLLVAYTTEIPVPVFQNFKELDDLDLSFLPEPDDLIEIDSLGIFEAITSTTTPAIMPTEY